MIVSDRCARALKPVLMAVMAMLMPWPGEARAQCNITAVASVTPLTTSAGTYTPPTVPVSTTLSLTMTYTVTSGLVGGQNCRARLTFQRPTLPATMTNGASTMPYTIRRMAAGGNVLMITGGTPVNTQWISVTGNGPAANTSAVRTSTFPAVFPILQPGGSFTAGSYSDTTLNVQVFNDPPGSAINLVRSLPFTMTGTVVTSCAISAPANTNQVIGVNALAQTTGMLTGPPSFTVSCTNISDVTLTSQNGAVTLGGVLEGALGAVPGFRNKIEYATSINGGAGAVTLDTALASSALGLFRSVTTSVTPTVPITPETSIVPLVAGGYSDVLTVSVIPR